jgi:hypothetical protein
MTSLVQYQTNQAILCSLIPPRMQYESGQSKERMCRRREKKERNRDAHGSHLSRNHVHGSFFCLVTKIKNIKKY